MLQECLNFFFKKKKKKFKSLIKIECETFKERKEKLPYLLEIEKKLVT